MIMIAEELAEPHGDVGRCAAACIDERHRIDGGVPIGVGQQDDRGRPRPSLEGRLIQNTAPKHDRLDSTRQACRGPNPGRDYSARREDREVGEPGSVRHGPHIDDHVFPRVV